MVHKRKWSSRNIRVAAAVVGVGALIAGAVVPASGHSDGVRPVVEDLDGPRGVAVARDGSVVVAEADGSFSKVEFGRRGHGGHHRGQRTKVTELGSVPPSFIAPAVATGRGGTVYVLTAGGEPGTGAATLYRWSPGRKGLQPMADIAAYQASDPDPYDLEDLPEESNPYGLAALRDGSVLVADAAGNDLLRVSPDGSIVTVARLKPRTVEVPDELPDEANGEPLPPAGTPVPSEGVATSVAVGADGYYYVGELRGFPATPDTSQIWRIKPGSVDAVCDPARPSKGACRRHADGFTSVVDLAASRNGDIYVLELVQQSWLQWELGLVDPPVGGLFRISHHGRVRELAAGELVLPGAVDVSHHGKIYVTGPVFGPGALSRIG